MIIFYAYNNLLLNKSFYEANILYDIIFEPLFYDCFTCKK